MMIFECPVQLSHGGSYIDPPLWDRFLGHLLSRGTKAAGQGGTSGTGGDP